MGLASAAATPDKPCSAAHWLRGSEACRSGLPVLSAGASRQWEEHGVAFHNCFSHLLITFCQILWGWNLLSGAGPCMPKGKFFWRVFARAIKPFLSQWKKKLFIWVGGLQFTSNSKFNPVTHTRDVLSLSLSLPHTPSLTQHIYTLTANIHSYHILAHPQAHPTQTSTLTHTHTHTQSLPLSLADTNLESRGHFFSSGSTKTLPAWLWVIGKEGMLRRHTHQT